MTNSFDLFNLHPSLVQAIAQCGYEEPTPIQTAVIPHLMAGEDVIGQAQTGTGKTAAFALPMLHNLIPGTGSVQALVLSPTRELALQVANSIASYGQFSGARVLAVYGGAAYGPQINGLRRGADIVVGTPGRLMDLMEKGVLHLDQLRMVVLDEADEMLSMGFAEAIESILSQTPPERQTALFSATLPPEIRNLAGRYLNQPHSVAIQREQVTGVGIEQRVYFVSQHEKTAALTRLFESDDVRSALIFVRTRQSSSELAGELSGRGYPAAALNGDLNQEARERTLKSFRLGQISVLVATDVAARGLDIDDISHVFNYDLPDDPELYVHRIGRTGRAGKTGIAITLVARFEKRMLANLERFARQKLVRATIPTEEDIRTQREQKLMANVGTWLQRGRCRRERELVEGLIEQGFDPIEVAAVALKLARAEEKQRPIEHVTIYQEEAPERPSGRGAARQQRTRQGITRTRDSRKDDSRHAEPRQDSPRFGDTRRSGDRNRITSHEPGMVRLALSMGKQDGLRPAEVVGLIAGQGNIPGSSIGKIFIHDNQTLVDIPEMYLSQVLKATRQAQIRRQPLELQVAS